MSASEYLAYVGQAHRKRYAQYFTPPMVVAFMQQWICGDRKSSCIFDPAFGLGAFAEGLKVADCLSGMDSDETILDYYHAHHPSSQCQVERGDYLLTFGRTYSNIICNPPYLRFQKFEQKEAVLQAFSKEFGIQLSGYTNIASAFLVKSICELESGGRLAYIMPSEFFNAGYGKPIKEILLKGGHLAHLVKLDCAAEEEAFPDATTSLCILLYDASRRYDNVNFYTATSLMELSSILETVPSSSMPYTDLRTSEKWESYWGGASKREMCAREALIPLSCFGHFSRGIATGANEFFVLKRSVIDGLHLNGMEYSPCITKSAQIQTPVFTQSDFERLANKDAPVYLFNVKDDLSPAALAYIRKGEALGYNRRYITSNRTPWYRMERRLPAPIILNVFSRQGYKVIRNTSNVFSLTNFHCFYPNEAGGQRIDKLFLYLLSDVGHRILAYSSRRYGNNLNKFEPNDLNNALVPASGFLDGIPGRQVESLMARLAAGGDVTGELEALFMPLIGVS